MTTTECIEPVRTIGGHRQLPREDIVDMLKKWGFLKDVTIEPPMGRIHLYADLAESPMLASTLHFRRGGNEKTSEEMRKNLYERAEREMKKALEYLRHGEPYDEHFEKIVDGKPYPAHWMTNGRSQRDCWRFGIEIYNALTWEYSQKGLDISPLLIQNRRLTTIRELERMSMNSASL